MGAVDSRGGRCRALTVFGAVPAECEHPAEASDWVLANGLASLTERWILIDGSSGEEEVVCILDANPAHVTVARDYYPLPGVARLTITAAQLSAGEWALRPA